MSKFNSSISVLGIAEVKVQQAILKLLENSLYQKELLGKTSDNLTEQLRRVRQQLSQVDFDIDEMTAQEIADKISVDMSACVASANASKVAAAASAASADEDATACHEDAQAVQTTLDNMEGTIAQYATQAATEASAAAVASATQAAQTASDAATTATQKAEAASTSAQNAATTAQQASNAAAAATQAIQAITFRNLAGPTTFNSMRAQYRKIATLPAVSTQANAVITFWGAMGGCTNAVLRQIYVSIGNRQSGNTFSALDIEAYYYRASIPTAADIVIYKESNKTFSVYLKGAANTYFRHELSMSYNEQVTAVSDTFKTSVPTGTQVWSFIDNAKRITTADELSNYALSSHKHTGVYQPAGSYASSNHTHDGVYQPAGSYASSNHTHDGIYVSMSGRQTVNGYKEFYGGIGMKQSHHEEGGQIDLFPGSEYSDISAFHIDVYRRSLRFFSDGGTAAASPMLQITRAENGSKSSITVSGPSSEDSNNSEIATTAWCRRNLARSTVEKIGWAHVKVLVNTTFLMSGLVSDSSATYNLKVIFFNTLEIEHSCLVNGTTVPIEGGYGKTATYQTNVSGSGSFTINNSTSFINVFVRIWR